MKKLKKIAIERGFANSRHSGAVQDGDLSLEELENVYGNPYLSEEATHRHRR